MAKTIESIRKNVVFTAKEHEVLAFIEKKAKKNKRSLSSEIVNSLRLVMEMSLAEEVKEEQNETLLQLSQDIKQLMALVPKIEKIETKLDAGVIFSAQSSEQNKEIVSNENPATDNSFQMILDGSALEEYPGFE
jgi:uncharacterized protein with von Willebrand factor type A (vWA) domain